MTAKLIMDPPRGPVLQGRGEAFSRAHHHWFVRKQANDPESEIVGISDIQTLTNKTLTEPIINDGQTKSRASVTYTVDKALTTSEFGKVCKFNSSSDLTATLPSVGSSDVDSWLIIMRLGTGKLTIQASDSDEIEKSGAGGYIFCIETGRPAANLSIYLASETVWAVLGGTGIWTPGKAV